MRKRPDDPAAADEGEENDCESRQVPLEETLAALRRSTLWPAAAPYLRAGRPEDHWREGCWRFLTYPAMRDGQALTAVFAVRLDWNEQLYQGTLVDDDHRPVQDLRIAAMASA